MTLPALPAITPDRARVLESVGINLAASAAFYFATTADRRHAGAAAAFGAVGLALWLASAKLKRPG